MPPVFLALTEVNSWEQSPSAIPGSSTTTWEQQPEGINTQEQETAFSPLYISTYTLLLHTHTPQGGTDFAVS